MANRKELPPEPPKPRVPGGSRRPSKLISRAGLPAVARREALNELLLSNNCAFGGSKPKQLKPEDVLLLRRMAQERFGGEHALLRRESVLALGRMRDVAAIDALTSLAISPLEHGAIRGAAAQALAAATPALAELVASRLAGAAPKPRAAKRRRKTPTSDRS